MKFTNSCESMELPALTTNNLGSFTISFWINIESLPESNPCFFSASNASNSEELLICAESTTVKSVVMTYTPPITSTNSWMHVSIVRN